MELVLSCVSSDEIDVCSVVKLETDDVFALTSHYEVSVDSIVWLVMAIR